MFCGRSTVDVSLGFATENIDSQASAKHSAFPKSQSVSIFPEVSVSKYFIIYQESKKRKNKANFIRKYMKYFINFLKNVKFNPVHNVINKVSTVFGCPKQRVETSTLCPRVA